MGTTTGRRCMPMSVPPMSMPRVALALRSSTMTQPEKRAKASVMNAPPARSQGSTATGSSPYFSMQFFETHSARLMCSQPCTATNTPACARGGSSPSMMARATSRLEAEPMRWPATSLVEQPMTQISPAAGCAALSRMSAASWACSVIRVKSIMIASFQIDPLYHQTAVCGILFS